MPTRVLMLGGVGCGNVGNDASFETVAALIRDAVPDARIVLVTPFPERAREVTSCPVVPMRQDLRQLRERSSRRSLPGRVMLAEARRLTRAVGLIRSSRLLLVPGTGILDDFVERPWHTPYALASWTLLARLLRRPVAYMGIGAGPIHDPVSRRLMVWSARHATYVSYRDEASRAYMAALDVDVSRSPVIPDVVFAREIPQPSPVRPAGRPLRVGIGVMAYAGWSDSESGVYERYIRTLATVVRSVLSRGDEVVFLTGQPVDELAVRDVLNASRTAESTTVSIPQVRDFDALVRAIGGTDLVVATRYHNVVAALMSDRPVIALSYAAKHGELLRAAGIEESVRAVEDADPAWILGRIEAVRAGLAQTRAAPRARAGWGDRVRADVDRVTERLR